MQVVHLEEESPQRWFFSLPCEDTAGRQPTNQEVGSYQELNHAGTLISDLQFPELWDINVV